MALGPGNHDDVISIGLTVHCTTQEEVARTSEQLGRVAAGFALEGMTATIGFMKLDPGPEGWRREEDG
jgi:hypothetical protein